MFAEYAFSESTFSNTDPSISHIASFYIFKKKLTFEEILLIMVSSFLFSFHFQSYPKICFDDNFDNLLITMNSSRISLIYFPLF